MLQVDDHLKPVIHCIILITKQKTFINTQSVFSQWRLKNILIDYLC